jgi:hypothetical protein
MSWINELTDEYSYVNNEGQKILSVSQGRVARLYREYQHNDDSALLKAAKAYIRENQYFPKVASFKEYVRMATYDKPKLSPLQEVKRMTEEQREEWRSVKDNELYKWELKRGTMRPLPEIEAEIDTARVELRRMT